ncbi:hypothetical protein [Jiella mangrovi]|uniref:Uncharacterized protein n=1 Tax=Jiella mangrovi TaxID=2821407 RepID=A0ABS4BI03_9HYPH|nr:hypothetical protein [Jiella mangrovi]MBP0616383.1 hypothetical protein [Jiella mangrovi]
MFLTIADLRHKRLWLEVRCVTCQHTTFLPVGLLPKTLRDDLPVHLAAAFFRCRCGSKQLSTLMVDLDAAKPKPPGF